MASRPGERAPGGCAQPGGRERLGGLGVRRRILDAPPPHSSPDPPKCWGRAPHLDRPRRVSDHLLGLAADRLDWHALLSAMGRGQASKGKREGGGPDWLNPAPAGDGDGGGSGCCVEEKPRRRRRGDDDDELDTPKGKGGISWKPLAFLIMMVGPALAGGVLNVVDSLNKFGIKLPGAHIFDPNPYRPCLQEYYADWAPEKLGSLDETLDKWKGREKQLFGALQKKYAKKANFARCVPAKAESKK
jgi:hypothetical protein